MKQLTGMIVAGALFAAISFMVIGANKASAQDSRVVNEQPDDPMNIRRFESDNQMDRRLPDNQLEVKLSYSPLVKRAAPAVVNIYTRKIVQSQRSSLFNDPFFRQFFGDRRGFGAPRKRVQGSLGSGVIVRESGIIVTNNHVVEGADEITVVLSDRREFEATVILTDPRTDLAILKVEGAIDQMFTTLSLADSDDIEVGDLVLAIGNPFGVGQTVTSGIVSGTARTQQGISDMGFFIQTDAAINPGNSGGPLVSMDGDLLGINSAIYSRSGGSNGIGFAIPANMVRSVLRAALDEGELARPWIGLKGQSVNADLAESLGLDRPGGVLVDAVWPDGPAELGGIQTGDVILSVSGKEIIDEGGMNYRVATQNENAVIPVSILRRGQLLEVDIQLALPPESPERNVTELDGRHPFQGVSIGNLNPRFNEELKIDPTLSGVIVLKLQRRTPAARYQFVHPGDRILEINGREIDSVRDVVRALGDEEGEYRYLINRRGTLQECLIVPNRSYRCSTAN